MLLIKSRLDISGVQGIGLFADEDIKKGTTVGRNDDRFGIIRFSEKEWEDLENTLSEESFVQIKRYSYKNKADQSILVESG